MILLQVSAYSFLFHLSSLLPSVVLLCLPLYYHSTNEEQKAVA